MTTIARSVLLASPLAYAAVVADILGPMVQVMLVVSCAAVACIFALEKTR